VSWMLYSRELEVVIEVVEEGFDGFIGRVVSFLPPVWGVEVCPVVSASEEGVSLLLDGVALKNDVVPCLVCGAAGWTTGVSSFCRCGRARIYGDLS